MAIRLHFWGADQTVTGSSHHIECAGQNVLLDCGLFQGHRQDTADINAHLALSPDQLSGKAAPSLNAVVLSHAHIDHSGDLPLLAKQGYRGPIYTTPATIDLCTPMLKDAAHIQESDAEFIGKIRNRRAAAGAPPVPRPCSRSIPRTMPRRPASSSGRCSCTSRNCSPVLRRMPALPSPPPTPATCSVPPMCWSRRSKRAKRSACSSPATWAAKICPSSRTPTPRPPPTT